jgi:hypothetical protein
MGGSTEHELTGARTGTGGGPRPLLRRVLWAIGTALAFVLLALLGLGLASLFSFGESGRPESEPVPVPRPPPRQVAEPPPVSPPPPASATPAPPPPAAAVPEQRPLVPGPALPLASRLRVRREMLRGIGALKDELARCPAEPVARPPGGRAALVLEGVAEAGGLRVVSSRLDAEGPVNDRFVSCARSVLEGKRLPVTGTTTWTPLRLFLPLGPNGNALSLPAASLTEAGPP